MEGLKGERLLDGGNKDDSILAPIAGLFRYMGSAIHRLKVPRASPLSSQVASKQTLQRFELVMQCGF